MPGLSYLPAEHLILLAGLLAMVGFLAGWLADLILKEEGFGIIVNGLIVIAGALLGFMLWARMGYPVGNNKQFIAALVTAISGVLLLVSCGIGRRFV
ncbi:GlsB/YeaQ/YmgE family stress response membrane protein [Bosea caraganae]|uniref:GlsB/YeaQ/YmgE family stress response membrane protein n=2 Tax=Bosea caraganae TaxID=2763117 RepID=A0A370L607_9HYPH|nr:GlsB/YeaQ/YmgE family stress response membrane protein [Bosea caraganae]RDJ24694.1 GlsB/YeaQ/YmgE family stress response membrane protein [Bosea caraganae]